MCGAAVGMSNLYVQGGLQLRQIAWFTLFLGGRRTSCSRASSRSRRARGRAPGPSARPLDRVRRGELQRQRRPRRPAVFCLYTTAAYKCFGRRGAIASLALIAVFGAVAPSVTPLLVPGLFGTTAAAFVPIKTLYGPAAFAGYLWL